MPRQDTTPRNGEEFTRALLRAQSEAGTALLKRCAGLPNPLDTDTLDPFLARDLWLDSPEPMRRDPRNFG